MGMGAVLPPNTGEIEIITVTFVPQEARIANTLANNAANLYSRNTKLNS